MIKRTRDLTFRLELRQAQAATTSAALMADEYQLLLRRQFVLLGKWYRTQDKAGREHIKWTADHHHHHHRRDHYNNHHGDGHCGTGAAADIDSNNNNPQCYYYPYKPAHVSRQTVEQKRVYAAPDAGALFSGDPPSSFRLRTPRPKIRTVRRPDGMTATVITTYKCKFVPLPRLHENTRTYGPVLSSLPVVLSRSVRLVSEIAEPDRRRAGLTVAWCLGFDCRATVQEAVNI